MMKLIAALCLVAATAAPAIAQDAGFERRSQAAMIEWMMANCDVDSVPAMTAAVAAMVVNGATKEQMDEARADIRGKIAETFGTDSAAACAAALKTMH